MIREICRRNEKKTLFFTLMTLVFLMCIALGTAQNVHAEEAPEPLVLNVTELNLDDYAQDVHVVYATSGFLDSSSIVINDPSVAKARYDNYEDRVVVTPVAAGETTLTIKGEYEGQEAVIPVKITQNYVDGYKAQYLSILKDGYFMAVPDDNGAMFVLLDVDPYFDEFDPKALGGEVCIDGTSYAGEYGFADTGNYLYLYFDSLPKLKLGTILDYTITYDGIEHSDSYTVPRRDLREDIEDDWIYVDPPKNVTYNGKAQTPAPKLYDDILYRVMKKGTDYTLKYSNNKNVGKAIVTITGKGNFKGSYSKYFKILPKGTSISKLTKGKKKITVKWKKRSTQTTGYEIRYSPKKSMKSAKTVKVKSYKTTSKTLKKLKAKKTYYVQVRTYKTVKGVTYRSSWSAKKYIKTK